MSTNQQLPIQIRILEVYVQDTHARKDTVFSFFFLSVKIGNQAKILLEIPKKNLRLSMETMAAWLGCMYPLRAAGSFLLVVLPSGLDSSCNSTKYKALFALGSAAAAKWLRNQCYPLHYIATTNRKLHLSGYLSVAQRLQRQWTKIAEPNGSERCSLVNKREMVSLTFD